MQPPPDDGMDQLQPELAFKARHRANRGRTRRNLAKAREHHDEAKGHMAKAQSAKDPHSAHGHLFRAVGALNKAKKCS